jgi:hypothetical protein
MERKNTKEQGRMRQKKSELIKSHVLLIFLMFFIPTSNLNSCLWTYVIPEKILEKQNDERTRINYLTIHIING